MLPEATLEQKIATGFHRNTLRNEEGGTDPEQFRVESVVDRVNTTGAVFLGLTLGCARCHDHKYDPVSQREFYQFFALLNGADEPTLAVPTQQQAKEQPALLAEIAQIEKRIMEVDANLGVRQVDWEKKLLADPAAQNVSGRDQASRRRSGRRANRGTKETALRRVQEDRPGARGNRGSIRRIQRAAKATCRGDHDDVGNERASETP